MGQTTYQPLTAQQAEDALGRLAWRLEAKTDALSSLLLDAAEAEVRYKVAYAKALLRSELKTVAEREADATLQCENELMARKTTEAVADACRESVRSLRDQLDAVRSLNASARDQSGGGRR